MSRGAFSGPPATLLGAVLAGGKSERMGSPKEGVRLFDGRAMIEAVLSALEAVCPGPVVVGSCLGFDWTRRIGLGRITDEHPGFGPLAGLEALLASGAARGYLVAACDQPLLSSRLLRRLTEGASDQARFFRDERTDEQLDPFPGYFPLTWLDPVRDAVREGRLSLRSLVKSLPVQWVPVSPRERRCLASANTPGELASLFSEKDTHA